MRAPTFRAAMAAALFAATVAFASWSARAARADDLPVIFVHGLAGSAQQYESQALRFASNGYSGAVRAFEYDTGSTLAVIGATLGTQNTPLTNFIDAILSEFDVDQVHLVGHSLGTSVSNQFLSNAGRAARVAKYIGIDGSSNANCGISGTTAHMDCLGVFAGTTGNVGGNNYYFAGSQTHVEVATSAESFAIQYEFITGAAPATTLVLPEPPGEVQISGRYVNFPANSGVNGGTVEVWEVHSGTGHRKYANPVATFSIDASGNWGPVSINGQHRYEFATHRPDTSVVGHAYFQPFTRSDHLVRLLSSSPTSAISTNTNVGPNHAAGSILRHKEWWSSHPSGENDTLTVSTRIPSNGPAQVLEVTGDILAGTGNGNLGIHIHDAAATPGESTLNLLPFFPSQPFQTGIDVYMPATDPPTGTISFVNAHRGGAEQVINLPNWASDGHRILVVFRDFAQGINTWGECKKAQPSPCSD